MKTPVYISRSLWLVISICGLCWMQACKSQPTPPAQTEETIAAPAPASEPQTDSLKNMLDQQRQERLKNKE
jgi:hypothetical protein